MNGYKCLMLFVLLALLSGPVNCQEVKFAMTSEGECGQFYNGIATIESEGDYYFINRGGERIGKAPGMLIWANEGNRIFKIDSSYFLANAKNKKISKEYDQLTYICPGYFSAKYYDKKNKIGVYCIISSKGKRILDPKKKVIACSFKACSPYVEFFYDNTQNGADSKSFKHVLFCNGKKLLEMDHIDRETLSPESPIIVGRDYIYNKRSHKIIELPQNHTRCITVPFADFYIVGTDYYDLEGNLIDQKSVSASSLGVSVVEVGESQYALFDTHDIRVNGEIYDKVDPLYWQSGIIAISKNGKWGYLAKDGSPITSFIYEAAGTCVSGWAVVREEGSSYVLNLNSNIKHKLTDRTLFNYRFEMVDDALVLYFHYSSADNDGGNGYINLTDNVGWSGLRSEPEFVNGIATNVCQSVYFLKSSNRIYVPEMREYAHFENIGEGLFGYDDYDGGVYHIYDMGGNEVYNSSASKLSIDGAFDNGVAPVFIDGGITVENERHWYGYIYNTWTSSKKEIVANYGDMGMNTDMADNSLHNRILYLDYYQLLGNNAMRESRFDDAIKYYDQALDLCRTFEEAEYGKGVALMHLGQYDMAYMALPVSDDIPGNRFAKVVCCYHLQDFDKALYHIQFIEESDPGYDEVQEIRRWAESGIEARNAEIEAEKQRKYERTMAILNAVTTGLNLFSQTMTAISSGQKAYSTPIQTYTPSFNKSSSTYSPKEKSCSFCHGTGMNPSKEYPPRYDGYYDDYDNLPCEVCGSRETHYHKACPSCNGKGYQITAF